MVTLFCFITDLFERPFLLMDSATFSVLARSVRTVLSSENLHSEEREQLATLSEMMTNLTTRVEFIMNGRAVLGLQNLVRIDRTAGQLILEQFTENEQRYILRARPRKEHNDRK
ncbi:MAG: hypothetical protein LBF24_01495 [Puniceicoccales bacterium]|nr:hypothetical protein [Puniceicoccales bacterium]